MFSLNDRLIKRLINETLPSFQNVDSSTDNLGFGFLYYGLVRMIRPEVTVVIGSKAGFSPIIFGLAVKDNEGTGVGKIACYKTNNKNKFTGEVHFVDPSYSLDRKDEDHWFGIGTWDSPESVRNLWQSFGLEQIIRHYKERSADFVNSPACPNEIDLLYIDGDHSYEGMKSDLTLYYDKLKKDALILLHDVDLRIKELIPEAGGPEVYEEIDSELFEKVRMPVFPGLAILKKK